MRIDPAGETPAHAHSREQRFAVHGERAGCPRRPYSATWHRRPRRSVLIQLVLYALVTFGVAVIGGLAGLVLGNLRLPLTLVFTGSAAAGAGTNIAVSAVAATTASIGHARSRRVDWRLAGLMIPPSAAAGLVGGWTAGRINEAILLTAIAALLVYSAVEVLRPPASRAPSGRRRRRLKAVALGAGIGLVGGVVGLILGSLRLPALIRVIGQKTAEAVGTNQVVGAALGYAALVGHLFGSGVDPGLVVAGAIGAGPGGLLGARFTGLLAEIWLRRFIAAALVVSASTIAARLLIGGS